MTRVRLAVVGAGRLGRIHARLASRLPEVELVAVVDVDPQARSAAAGETGARGVAELRDVIGEVDAAVVATPTFAHLAVASELIRGGVHVLVEKPLASTVAESDELVQLARRRHVVLQTGHVERFNPALSCVKDRLSTPKYIEARRQSGFTFRSTDVGVVLDLMIHDIDVTLSLVKSPVCDVEALGVSVLGGHEDMVNARLRFENGAVANLTASRTSYVSTRMMNVVTPTCFATIDFGAKRTTLIEPREDVLRRRWSLDKLEEADRVRLRDRLFDELLVKTDIPIVESNAIEQELVDFAKAIRTGRPPQVTGVDGRDAVMVAERVLEQVRAHTWDGADGGQRGPLALPRLPLAPLDASNAFADADTVVLRRMAG